MRPAAVVLTGGLLLVAAGVDLMTPGLDPWPYVLALGLVLTALGVSLALVDLRQAQLDAEREALAARRAEAEKVVLERTRRPHGSAA